MSLNIKLIQKDINKKLILGVTDNKRLNPKNVLKTYKKGVARKTTGTISKGTNDDAIYYLTKHTGKSFLNESIRGYNFEKDVQLGKAMFENNEKTINKKIRNIPINYLAKGSLGRNTVKIKGANKSKRVGIDTSQMAESLGVEIERTKS